MDRRWWISLLGDLYGELLTDKQRLFFRLHHDEDLSMGEIALQHGVSRPAVHRAVKRAEGLLLDYERKMGLGARLVRDRQILSDLEAALAELDGKVGRENQRGVKRARQLVAALMKG
ncbi:MAG: YlxM family DNA-binding protein [Bacillota bacterium]